MEPSTNETKTKTPKSTLVETVRSEAMKAIAANIFRSDAENGRGGHHFKLSRAWKPDGADAFRYSERFYARNAAALADVIARAAQRCDQLDKALGNEKPPVEKAA